jgi:tetratricopeptide (TPR) repeat protein
VPDEERHRRYAERADTLRAALAAPSELSSHARALIEYGDACRFAGRIGESEDAFRRLLEEAMTEGAIALRAEARMGLGNAACARSRWDEAVVELTHAVDDARLASDRRLGARARCILASAHFNRGDLDQASVLLREALQSAREYELASVEAPALISLGVIALAQGELHEAFARLSEGILLAERIADEHWAATARSYLAIQAHLSGRAAAAEPLYEASIAELDSLGIRRAAGLCRLALATLFMAQGRWSDARSTLEQAISSLAVTCPDYESTLQAGLAICALAGGHVPAFRHHVAYARRLLTNGPPAARAPVVERVARLDELSHSDAPLEPRSLELALIDRACAGLGGHAVGPSLVVEREWKLFVVPGSTQRVSLARRGPLRRLLGALVVRHAARKQEYVKDEELIASVWPDERILPKPASKRLHTAVSTLRAMGLRPWIDRAADGYRLRPDLIVRVVAEDADDLLTDL